MLVVVNKQFKDKFTGDIRNIGDTFEVGRKRYNELVKAGDFVSEVIEATPEVELEEENNGDIED